MIMDVLDHGDRYAAVPPGFAAAFAFLRRQDLAALPDGRYPIDGDRVYAMIMRGDGKSQAGARLEYHRRYIDVQFSVAGTDVIGWRELSACASPAGDYDAKKDCGHMADAPAAWIALPPGAFMVLFPSDAHAPMAGAGPLHKAVVKVAVDAAG